MEMKIVLGADHRGYGHKEFLKLQNTIAGITITWIDVGAFDEQRSDYPIFAHAACKEMLTGNADKGILICGTGVGMAIAANRYKKIRAALAWNEQVAQLSAQDDNANILVLPSDFISYEQSLALVTAWLAAQFKGGRYGERVAMIDELEKI